MSGTPECRVYRYLGGHSEIATSHTVLLAMTIEMKSSGAERGEKGAGKTAPR